MTEPEPEKVTTRTAERSLRLKNRDNILTEGTKDTRVKYTQKC